MQPEAGRALRTLQEGSSGLWAVKPFPGYTRNRRTHTSQTCPTLEGKTNKAFVHPYSSPLQRIFSSTPQVLQVQINLSFTRLCKHGHSAYPTRVFSTFLQEDNDRRSVPGVKLDAVKRAVTILIPQNTLFHKYNIIQHL